MNRRSDMRRGDRRNPYGSRGGYVSSRRSMRDRRDREDMRRDRRDMGYDERQRRFEGHYGDIPFEVRENEDFGYENDMARRRDRRGRYMSDRDMARGGRGNDRNDYGDYEDYGDYNDYGAEPLSEKELKEWAEDMMEEIESTEKQMLSMEHIKKKAEEMGMEFKKFSPTELYVTTVMMYTDYHKTIGGGNIDIFIRLAHDWLKDKDSGLKYGEKLDAYYEYVVCGNE